MDKGYKFEFNKGSCRIFDKTGEILAMEEQSRHNLFYSIILENKFFGS